MISVRERGTISPEGGHLPKDRPTSEDGDFLKFSYLYDRRNTHDLEQRIALEHSVVFGHVVFLKVIFEAHKLKATIWSIGTLFPTLGAIDALQYSHAIELHLVFAYV